MQIKRILSGVQPSGKLHLGNYFGAVRQHIALQDEGQCFYFIANYHALTTIQNASQMADNSRDAALDYLALGFDPAKAAFFRQSDVPEVAELAWILSTVTPMGLLERAVSYKEKIEKGIEASVGLFTYPVLMAADILIYRSHVVPVGKDQVQHLEMTRDIAVKFNLTFGEVFPLPTYKLDNSKHPRSRWSPCRARALDHNGCASQCPDLRRPLPPAPGRCSRRADGRHASYRACVRRRSARPSLRHSSPSCRTSRGCASRMPRGRLAIGPFGIHVDQPHDGCCKRLQQLALASKRRLSRSLSSGPQ